MCLFVCLLVCLFVCLFVSLSFCLFVSLSFCFVCLFLCLPIICLSVSLFYLFVSLSFCLFLCLSFCLFGRLFVCLSVICMSVYLVCLIVCLLVSHLYISHEFLPTFSFFRRSKASPPDYSVFNCISMLARALGDSLANDVKSLLDLMLAAGLRYYQFT